MTQHIEHYPKCKTIQNMRVTFSNREELDSDGNKKQIKTKSYHCEVCQLFVRSEDLEES